MRKALALAVVLASAASGARADDLIEAGRVLVETNCARCHAIAGPGPSPVADAPAFSTFERMWPVESLAEAFAEGITVYHPTVIMPEFVFEPPEIDALLAYLKSVQE
jgi:mono/diheme cytochrome c family protein